MVSKASAVTGPLGFGGGPEDRGQLDLGMRPRGLGEPGDGKVHAVCAGDDLRRPSEADGQASAISNSAKPAMEVAKLLVSC
jgi:hypothetical protein